MRYPVCTAEFSIGGLDGAGVLFGLSWPGREAMLVNLDRHGARGVRLSCLPAIKRRTSRRRCCMGDWLSDTDWQQLAGMAALFLTLGGLVLLLEACTGGKCGDDRQH